MDKRKSKAKWRPARGDARLPRGMGGRGEARPGGGRKHVQIEGSGEAAVGRLSGLRFRSCYSHILMRVLVWKGNPFDAMGKAY